MDLTTTHSKSTDQLGQNTGQQRFDYDETEDQEDEENIFNNGKHRQSVSANYLILKSQKIQQTKEGYLMKKSPKILVGWQKRYCVVKDMKFYYFKNKGDVNFKGCVDFTLASVELIEKVKDKNNESFVLLIKGIKRNFEFKIDPYDIQLLKEWKQVIKQNLEKASLIKKNILYDEKELFNQKEFWRNDRISLTRFEQEADTGDLLLFKGKSTMCKFQRALTQDDYDHVALLLRFEDGQLYLFDAVSQEGVGLCNWHKFLRNQWHTIYQKIVFRHINIERNEQFIESLDQFQQISRGKKFSVSAKKLMRRWRKNTQEDKDNQQKTYFCSELVAAAYKALGILPENINSASYWPGSFSIHGGLKLQKGSLENELLLDFSIFEKKIYPYQQTI